MLVTLLSNSTQSAVRLLSKDRVELKVQQVSLRNKPSKLPCSKGWGEEPGLILTLPRGFSSKLWSETEWAISSQELTLKLCSCLNLTRMAQAAGPLSYPPAFRWKHSEYPHMRRVTEIALSSTKRFKLRKDSRCFLVCSVNEFITTHSVDTTRKTVVQDALACVGVGEQSAAKLWSVDWNSVSSSADTWFDRLWHPSPYFSLYKSIFLASFTGFSDPFQLNEVMHVFKGKHSIKMITSCRDRFM